MNTIGPAHSVSGTVRQVGLVQTAYGVSRAYDIWDAGNGRLLPLNEVLERLVGKNVTIDVQVDDTSG